MRVKIDLSALKKTRWYEFAVRFLFGGLITAGAGMIAKEFGPGVGGLFLAFPAIFPAGATLIEKHEKQKKERAGLRGSARGRKATAVDAAGASIGSIGLFIFALVVKRYLVSHGPWLVLMGATMIWAGRFSVAVAASKANVTGLIRKLKLSKKPKRRFPAAPWASSERLMA